MTIKSIKDLQKALARIEELQLRRAKLTTAKTSKLADVESEFAEIPTLDAEIEAIATSAVKYARRARPTVERNDTLPTGTVKIKLHPEKVDWEKGTEAEIMEQLEDLGLYDLCTKTSTRLDRNALKRADLRHDLEDVEGLAFLRSESLVLTPSGTKEAVKVEL